MYSNLVADGKVTVVDRPEAASVAHDSVFVRLVPIRNPDKKIQSFRAACLVAATLHKR